MRKYKIVNYMIKITQRRIHYDSLYLPQPAGSRYHKVPPEWAPPQQANYLPTRFTNLIPTFITS